MEILHKAKRMDNGKWVEGYYCRLPVDLEEAIDVNGKIYVKNIIDCIIETELKQNNIFNSFPFEVSKSEVYKVDPYTLCIYIGRNDDKGNKIWLHDIIEISTYNYTEPAEYYFGEIIYCEAWACWCIKEPNNEKPIPLHECEGSYKTEITRLGNIFDDADLLGV